MRQLIRSADPACWAGLLIRLLFRLLIRFADPVC